MTLLQQFQAFIGSILFGGLITFFWSLFNRLFYRFSSKLIRLPFETIFFLICALLYFLFLKHICHAILNIHYLLGLMIGCIIYLSVYAKYINAEQEKVYTVMNNKIFQPFKKRCDIIKARRKERKKRRNEKRKDKKKSKEHD